MKLYHYSRFFGVSKAEVVADLGDAYAVRHPNGSSSTVQKNKIDSERHDDIGAYWSSMDVWADQVVKDEEAWTETLKERHETVEEECQKLREKAEGNFLEGRARLQETYEWRRNFKFEEPEG